MSGATATPDAPDDALGAELASVVAAVPGVRMLYPARGVIAAGLDAVRARLTGAGSLEAPIALVRSGGTVSVRVRVGVSAGSPAPATVRAVHDAVAQTLEAHGLVPRAVEIRVVRVG